MTIFATKFNKSFCNDMKKTSILLPLALIAVSLGSCSKGGQDTDKLEIEEFQISQTIKTADRNYRFMIDDDTIYFDFYTSIQWPDKLGHSDVKPLQDSIVAFCYGDTTGLLNSAISSFLSDTAVFKDMPLVHDIERVDSIPESDRMRSYFSNSTASVMEITEQFATYQVTLSSYLGGAHPYTAIFPFTYDLDSAKVLGIDDILTNAGVDSVMPVIRGALARQFEVPVEALDRAGIFTSQLNEPGRPYISGNVLYFHYNPYEIAPYSAGMIDVAVYPYEVERWLRPEAKRLLESNF